MPEDKQAHIHALPMSLYPTMESIQEVINLAESKLPITDSNEMYSLLMTFQNTLIKYLTSKE
jgi:hypothetical protein